MASDLEDVRAWLAGPARSEYADDREGHRSNSEPFSWAAARLSEDLVSRSVAERREAALTAERERFESWLRHAAPSLVGKCRSVGEICDKLADYVKRGVY